MKRVISLTICVIILAFTMCSCGNQLPFTGDSSTKELKFEDKHFEKYMNVMFGKLDGGVTQEDMDSIKQIQLMGNDYYKNFIEYMYDDYEYNLECMHDYGYQYTLETGGKLGKVPTVPQIKYSDDYEYATSLENDFEPMTYNDVAKFRNLQVLVLESANVRNFNFLSSLKNLKHLCVYGSGSLIAVDLNKVYKDSIVTIGIKEVLNPEALLDMPNLVNVNITKEIPIDIINQLTARGVTVYNNNQLYEAQ